MTKTTEGHRDDDERVDAVSQGDEGSPRTNPLEEIRHQFEATRAQLEATNARIEAKAGRNLVFAIGTGVILGAIFLSSLFFLSELFSVLVALVTSVTVLELVNAFRTSGRRVPRVGGILGSIIIVSGAFFYGAEGMLLGLILSAVLLTIWRLIEGLLPGLQVPPKTLLRDVMAGIFCLVYVPFLAGFAVLLVQAERGEWWVFSLVAIVVSVDIGAYAAGVTLGKHKMTPRISPNKTWEGFAGAAVAGITVAVLLAIFALQQPWWVGLLLGALLLLTATGGDLTESLIKRNLGVKDMSSWIPGHGGFLDRLDSILPSAPAAYLVLLLVSATSISV